MQPKNLIAVTDFCFHYQIEYSFITDLQQNNLIVLTSLNDDWFIEQDELVKLEKIICLYYDLDINLEGIETINHLLKRINTLQDEIIALRNQLSFYDHSKVI